LLTSSVLPAPLTILLGDVPSAVRLALSKVLRTESRVQIVGSTTGIDSLIAKVGQLRPDLVIVGERAATNLEHLALHHRGPVLLYTEATYPVTAVRAAAAWGVYDHFSALPAATHPDYGFLRRELLRKIFHARVLGAGARRFQAQLSTGASVSRLAAAPAALLRGVVVIGGSTGGAAAAEQVVRSLQPGLSAAVVVAIHLPAAFTTLLVERLRRAAALPVVVGRSGLSLEAGKIVVVPGGRNWVIRGEAGHRLWLESSQETVASFDEPNIDMLLSSAARAAGRHMLGVVLTGLGRDGAAGARLVRQLGGTVVAQDEQSSAVFGMPKAVIQCGAASAVLPLGNIARYVNAHVLSSRVVPLSPRSTAVTRSYTR
jgi:two-component system chemotaxis response regulator CheB